MPDLPIEQYNYYVACDPGIKGAIARMSANGESVQVWPMPVADGELDLRGISQLFADQRHLPRVCIGIEWPTAWPGAFNNVIPDAVKFGKQLGQLEMAAFMAVGSEHYFRIDPKVWKNRLGLDGKTIEGANERAAGLWDTFYPDYAGLVRGPRGGLLDGNLDALLIAHFLRTRSAAGMKSIVDKFGKGSDEALAFILGGGRRKRKLQRRNG